jgi:hypothetical protein
MRPLGFQFSVGGLYTLTPWPIGQALVLQVSLQVFLDQLTGPLLLPHSYRGILVHISQFSEHHWYILQSYHRASVYFMDTKILMVLDIPQGDPVPLSRHC